MCILGRDKVTELVERFKCISPFEYSLLDGDGYVLTVRDETTLQYLQHKSLVSREIVFIPPDYVAHLSAKSDYIRMGLSFLSVIKVHSGFVGRLALETVNLSNDRAPITIKRGEPFSHIEFSTRLGAHSPYLGPYQFQHLTEEEVEIYRGILSKDFPGIYREEALRQLAERRLR